MVTLRFCGYLGLYGKYLPFHAGYLDRDVSTSDNLMEAVHHFVDWHRPWMGCWSLVFYLTFSSSSSSLLRLLSSASAVEESAACRREVRGWLQVMKMDRWGRSFAAVRPDTVWGVTYPPVLASAVTQAYSGWGLEATPPVRFKGKPLVRRLLPWR